MTVGPSSLRPRAFVYGYADLVLHSETALGHLPPATGKADISYRCSSAAMPTAGRVVRTYTFPDGADWLRIRASGALTLFEFPGLACFTIDSESGAVTGYPGSTSDPNTMTHLLVDQVLPLHLVAIGRHVLHASAVAMSTPAGPRAVLFLGKSGAGKSSAAAACCLAGAVLLADDFALVEACGNRAAVVPANLGLRLWGDVAESIGPHESAPVAEYTTKTRAAFAGPRFSEVAPPVPIGAVVSLGQRGRVDREMTAETVTPADALMLVVENSYRIDMRSPAANADIFAKASRLVESVPVVRVGLTDDLGRLEATGRSLLELLGEHVGEAALVRSPR